MANTSPSPFKPYQSKFWNDLDPDKLGMTELKDSPLSGIPRSEWKPVSGGGAGLVYRATNSLGDDFAVKFPKAWSDGRDRDSEMNSILREWYAFDQVFIDVISSHALGPR